MCETEGVFLSGTISPCILQSAANASTSVACECSETQDGGEKGTARPHG